MGVVISARIAAAPAAAANFQITTNWEPWRKHALQEYRVITVSRRKELTEGARALQNEFWRRRREAWTAPPDMEGFLPIRTDLLIRSILCIELVEPEFIEQEKAEFEIAGLLERDIPRITIAQKFSPDCKRFTAAHEIAHWVIHPDVIRHRDRPLGGHERSNEARDPEEQEADMFAAELLMPNRQLTRYFSLAFGNPLLPTDSRLDLLRMHRPTMSLSELSGCLRKRSMLAATARSFGPEFFLPLYERFGVSQIAMAIQLEHLGLVR